MSYERIIVHRLFESKDLCESSFEYSGSIYKCIFGKYYKDNDLIGRDEYFDAKEKYDSDFKYKDDGYNIPDEINTEDEEIPAEKTSEIYYTVSRSYKDNPSIKQYPYRVHSAGNGFSTRWFTNKEPGITVYSDKSKAEAYIKKKSKEDDRFEYHLENI